MTDIEPLLNAKRHVRLSEGHELHGRATEAILEASRAIDELQRWIDNMGTGYRGADITDAENAQRAFDAKRNWSV